MSAENIQKRLEQVLLNGEEMSFDLYQDELEEQVGGLIESMKADNDEFTFAITENSGDVAMVLVEGEGEVRINEQARDRLKELWPLAYESNLKQFIPDFAEELSEGQIPITGVKTVQ